MKALRLVKFALLVILLTVAYRGYIAYAQPDNRAAAGEVLKFDIAENHTKFTFDESPLHEDGLPAFGGEFITQGYLYPEGTLTDSIGVLENGDPAFPDQVIGEWICFGFHVGDGAHTTEGPWVVTTQIFQLTDEYGGETIVTTGYELPTPDMMIHRAISGGTGRYNTVRGEQVQSLLRLTDFYVVNMRTELHLAE